MYCRECGKPLLESDKFCSNCGTPVKKITPPEEPMFRTEEGARQERAKTAPLPSFKTETPAEEKKGERLIFEAIGDSIKWDTDAFPSKTRKKTEDVDFHWNLSDDEFRNRPARREPRRTSAPASSPWTAESEPTDQKSTGLKPSDTNSWDELFDGTRSDEKQTRQAKRDSLETYWEDMFRRDEASQSPRQERRSTAELTAMPPRRVSISRDDISRGIGDEGRERVDQNKLEETMALSRKEMEGALRDERREHEQKEEKPETRESRVVAELASMAAAGIGAGPTFVPKGTEAVTLPEEKESKPVAPADKEKELTGAELEQELFREMDEPMSEAQKMRARQTEKIDKFYTFNKKNEEFQKLLDQEYERFKKSREEDDFAEDLYKLGEEDFFEDHSKGKHSQAEEMARARQTFFHTDEFAELKDILEKEEAGKEAAAPTGEAPAEEPEAVEESLTEPEADEEPAPSHRARKQKKSFFGRLFGRDDEDEFDAGEAAAAAGAAAVTGAVIHEAVKKDEPAEEEMPAEPEEIAEEETAAETAAEAESAEEAASEPAAEESAAEEPAEESAEEPAAEEPAEEPAEEAAAEEPAAIEEEPEEASIVFEPEEELQEAESAEEEIEEPAEEPAVEESAEEPVEEPAAEISEETAEPEPEMPAEEPAEEPVSEPAEEPVAEEPVEEPAEEPAAEETVEEPAAEAPEEEAAAEEPAAEESEEEPEAASIVFGPDGEAVLEVEQAVRKVLGEESQKAPAEEAVSEPAAETEEAAVTEQETPAGEPAVSEETTAEEVSEGVARTTEPTRVYEKGDIPTPTTEEEQATAFEESRAEAWDAFFSDDEDVNAGNTFDAENEADEMPEKERHGASILASILVVILVFLLALIVVRLAMPDSIISIKLDQITEKILGLFHGGAAAAIIQHLM